MRTRGAAVLFAAFATLTCGDEPAGPVAVATVTVTPANPTLEVLDTLRLTATARDAQGNITTGRDVEWFSTPPGRVEVIASGRVQGFHGGEATVTAVVDRVGGSTTVTVVVSVASVQISPSAVAVFINDTFRLSALVLGTGGVTPTNPTVTWVSLDTLRAAVSSSGLVTARGAGSAVITATAGGKSDSANIAVPAPVVSVEITPPSDTISADSTAVFSAIARDSIGTILIGRPVNWTSSNDTIATVSSAGVATGYAAGTVYVIAAVEQQRDSAELRVRAGATVSRVVISPDTGTFMVGTRRQLAVAIYDSADNPLNRPVEWSSTDSARATVSETGFVTTLDTGTVSIGALSQTVGDSARFVVRHIDGRFVAVAPAEVYTCAFTDQAAAYCWGVDDDGGIGDGEAAASCVVEGGNCRDAPTPLAGSLSLTGVVSSELYSCGLGAGGQTYCWGTEYDSVMGGLAHAACPRGPCALAPVSLGSGFSFTKVAAGLRHVCGLASDSTAHCWGSNQYHQLGSDSTSTAPRAAPRAVSGGHRFVAITAGDFHTCALDQDGAAWCWGRALEGQVGSDSVMAAGSARAHRPVRVTGGHEFQSLATGSFHNCGLDVAGTILCWGANSAGTLGNGSQDLAAHPVPVSGGRTYSAVSAGFRSSCGISGPATYCWGFNDYFQLGFWTGSSVIIVPTPVSGQVAFTKTFNGRFLSCGLTSSGALYCWGNNSAGLLGTGWVGDPTSPLPQRVAGQP